MAIERLKGGQGDGLKKMLPFYYEVSPPIADVISRHETLKSIARVILGPIVKIVD